MQKLRVAVNFVLCGTGSPMLGNYGHLVRSQITVPSKIIY